jgi:hypothetical protein
MCLDKRIVIVIIFLAICVEILSAEAPELRNVMPNSWKKVTRLGAEEEEQFIVEQEDIILFIKRELTDAANRWNKDLPDPNKFFIYKQIVWGKTFYRILCADIEDPPFLSDRMRFVQYLVYEGRLICKGLYNINQDFRGDREGLFNSIDIISDGEYVKGVLLVIVVVNRDYYNDSQWDGSAYRKGQLRGGVGGAYYLVRDIEENINSADEDYVTANCPNIEISASECLVDPNMPLRYSLQNAFDGDPATSYVENTGDDLIVVRVTIAGAKKLAIINGYAQTSFLYYANNRIKSLVWPIKIPAPRGGVF